MKELRCALALALVGLVSTTPYGYGVKGGSGGAAKAGAISGASTGAISGLPLSIPSGGSYSGSYSNSASSSFSSSSASSSSGSFSFSGPGASGTAGFDKNAISNGGCATGACQGGLKDVSGSHALGGSAANGLQGYNAANAVAGAGAGAMTGVGYGHKDGGIPCASGDCPKPQFGSAGGHYNVQSGKDNAEKSEADALSGISTDNLSYNKCTSGLCGPSAPTGTPTGFDSNGKCTSGKCGTAPAAVAPADSYGTSNKCVSGNCEPSSIDTPNIGSYESASKCASGQCGSAIPSVIFSPSYGSNNICTSGQCGPVSHPEPSPTAYESDSKCSSGQCGTSSQPESTNYNPISDCSSGHCGSSFQSSSPQVNYGSYSKPSSYNGGSSLHPDIPSTSYGHPVAASPSIDVNSKCTYGNCGPITPTVPSSANYGPYDIHVSGSKSTYNSNEKTYNLDKNSDDSGSIKSDCSLGVCSPSSSSNTKPTSPAPISNTYPSVGKPSNYGYNPTLVGGPTAGYIKPSSDLTTPKLQANYIPSAGPSNNNIPGSYSNTLHAHRPCSTGNCDISAPSTPLYNSNSFSTNYVSPKYPNAILPTGSSGTPCGSPNCAHNYHNTPGYGSAPGYQIPAGPASPSRPNVCTPGSCSTYPSSSNPGYIGVTIGATAPSSSYGQSTSQASVGSTGIAGFPSFPVGSKYPALTHTEPQSNIPTVSTTLNCKTSDCSPYPSPTTGVSIGTAHNIPPVHGIFKPNVDQTSDENLPPYTGGFGGPSGLLKPHENVTPGVPLNTYNKPTVPVNVHNPTGANSYIKPSIPTGAYSPTASNSYSKPTITPIGTNEPTGCSSGNCGPHSGQPAIAQVTSVPTLSSGSHVPNGPSVSSSGVQIATSIAASNAEAEGTAYTSGFGGPSGLLKPHENVTPGVPLNTYNKPTVPVNVHNPTGANSYIKPSIPTGAYSPTASNSYSKPTITPIGTNEPTGCSSGNCGPHSGQPAIAQVPSVPTLSSGSHVPNGPSVSSSGVQIATSAAASNAEAEGTAYTSGFGGPSGLLKPHENVTPGVPLNTYNKPTVPVNVHNPTGANSYIKPSIPTGAYSPTASNSYSKPTITPIGTNEPTGCSSGNCGPHSGQPAIAQVPSVPTLSSGSHVPNGPSVSSSGVQIATSAAASNAEAEGTAYTGGFGGPPGLLKPYDGGKLVSAGLTKYPSSSSIDLPHSTSNTGNHGSYGTGHSKLEPGTPKTVGNNAGVAAGGAAQASVVAGASSGAIGSSNDQGFGGQYGSKVHDHKSNGCGGGCGSNTGGSYSGGSSFDINGGLGLPKLGHTDGLSDGLSASGATARSLAGAVSSGNTFGTSGSFASSVATAHASAGAGVKGGYYGRR